MSKQSGSRDPKFARAITVLEEMRPGPLPQPATDGGSKSAWPTPLPDAAARRPSGWPSARAAPTR